MRQISAPVPSVRGQHPELNFREEAFMNTRLLRTGAALLLSAVLCGSALSLTGCGNKISHNPNTSEAYAPYVPDSKIDE